MIKIIFLTSWTFMRWLRLAIGLYLVYVGISENDVLVGIIGALFSFLALFNQGCGGGNCAFPRNSKE